VIRVPKQSRFEMPEPPSPPGRGGRKKMKSALESFLTGLLVAGGFGAFWYFTHGGWWLLAIALFAGLLPAARALSSMIASRASEPVRRRLDERQLSAENERTVLRIARERGGRITPSLVVLGSSMALEEAERALDDFAKKGHATVRIREDGRIEYEFSEFLPE
jgi:hypothetical protein